MSILIKCFLFITGVYFLTGIEVKSIHIFNFCNYTYANVGAVYRSSKTEYIIIVK